MDYKPFTPLSEENIDGHMIFGMTGQNCQTTIINGRVLYKDREFVALMRTRSTRGPWLSPRSSGARSTIAPTNYK